MFPCSSVYNVPNLALCKAKSFSQFTLIYPAFCIKPSNLMNVFFSYFDPSMLLPGWGSFFSYFIFMIFFMCSNPKMIWINTTSIIARMTNLKPFGNLSFMNFVGSPMCSNHFSRIAYMKYAIATTKDCCIPFPTRMKWDLFNLRKKPIDIGACV